MWKLREQKRFGIKTGGGVYDYKDGKKQGVWAGLTALVRGPIGRVRSTPETAALLRAAVEEAVATGIALKAGLEPDDVARTMKQLDGMPAPMMASMCHDLLGGKPLELDGLSGAVARLARTAGVAAPTHAFIAAALAPFRDGQPAA